MDMYHQRYAQRAGPHGERDHGAPHEGRPIARRAIGWNDPDPGGDESCHRLRLLYRTSADRGRRPKMPKERGHFSKRKEKTWREESHLRRNQPGLQKCASRAQIERRIHRETFQRWRQMSYLEMVAEEPPRPPPEWAMCERKGWKICETWKPTEQNLRLGVRPDWRDDTWSHRTRIGEVVPDWQENTVTHTPSGELRTNWPPVQTGEQAAHRRLAFAMGTLPGSPGSVFAALTWDLVEEIGRSDQLKGIHYPRRRPTRSMLREACYECDPMEIRRIMQAGVSADSHCDNDQAFRAAPLHWATFIRGSSALGDEISVVSALLVEGGEHDRLFERPFSLGCAAHTDGAAVCQLIRTSLRGWAGRRSTPSSATTRRTSSSCCSRAAATGGRRT